MLLELRRLRAGHRSRVLRERGDRLCAPLLGRRERLRQAGAHERRVGGARGRDARGPRPLPVAHERGIALRRAPVLDGLRRPEPPAHHAGRGPVPGHALARRPAHGVRARCRESPA